MLCVARRLLRIEEDAEDVVQEAFLSAFRSIDRFRGDSALSTWLHRIVVNAALMKLRRSSSRPEVRVEDCLPTFDAKGRYAKPVELWSAPADSLLLREETRARVRERVATLPPKYSEVVALRDIDGLDTAETGRVLGISETAVKVRLHRARLALTSLLRDVFDEGFPRCPSVIGPRRNKRRFHEVSHRLAAADDHPDYRVQPGGDDKRELPRHQREH